MIGTIARFELGSRLRRLSTWIYVGLFLVLAFFLFIASAGAFQSIKVGFGTGGKILVNSPFTLTSLMSGVSYFSLLVIAALAGQAVNQDFQHGTYALVFTAPVRKPHYLAGRFLGAFGTLVVIQLAIAAGCWLGSLMPFVDETLVGQNRLLAYLAPYLVIILPNLFILAALFFALGTLTRHMRAVYVTSVVLLVGFLVASTLTQKLEDKLVAALVDPFGGTAFEQLTEYWTISEKNSRLPTLSGVLLANRLLWMGLGAGALVLTFLRFRMLEPLVAAGTRARRTPIAEAEATRKGPGPLRSPGFLAPARPGRAIALLPRLTWLAFRETVKNIHFLVIVLAGVLFIVLAARVAGAMYGTETYPVTYAMIELASGSFALFLLIIVTLFSGEIIWREREARIDQIIDALPVPSWLFLASKLGGLLLVGVLLQVVVGISALGVQVTQGYFRIQPGLYATELLGLRMLDFFTVAGLAIFVHVLANQKIVGHFVMVLYFVVGMVLPIAGFEHRLYRYGSTPGYTYSDMNGYGHQLWGWGWFTFYWALAALGLVLIANLLWPRGQDVAWRPRWQGARQRLRGPLRVALVSVALAFVATGGFIFWNTNVRNEYLTSSELDQRRVEYEKKYKRLADDPQPRITAVDVFFDIVPDRRAFTVTGTYELVNPTDQPIRSIHVNLSDQARIRKLSFAGVAAPTRSDDRLDFHTFELPQPLGPGATTRAEFALHYEPRGFTNGGIAAIAVDNGSFINSMYLPSLGYVRGVELSEDDDRRKRGLPPRPRMADLDDPQGRQRNFLSDDGDWLPFTARACTSGDQIALVPGYLVRQWKEGERACFAFETDARILNFFSVLSARYRVKRDRWSPPADARPAGSTGGRGGEVAIEVYYHPGHEYNLERMIRASKASLDYFTRNFSPYQHRQLRILEFPRYESFAQAFPNTIPYSEAIGFIARVDPSDPEDVDYPYYITAHEVAHQWWGHQVAGADVQGAALLSESLAQYSALMVMKATYGAKAMKRFLAYELDRYLSGRSLERKKELPLVRVEDQPYIYYQKASLVFYALADIVGEDTVNRALAALLAKHAFSGPPYPRSVDLIAELRAVIPAEHAGLIQDLFETITLYENRARRAHAQPLGQGRYRATIDVSAKKLRADELGKETELSFQDPVDIGVLDAKNQALVLKRHTLGPGDRTIVLEVTGKPARAGIDPLNKLIDRRPKDNTVVVEMEGGAGTEDGPR